MPARATRRLCGILAGLVLCLTASLARSQDDPMPPQKPVRISTSNPLKPEQVWIGRFQDNKLRGAAPRNHLITSPEGFAKLWKAWREGEVPDIDFEASFVYVTTVDGPNSIFLNANNAAGNVTTLAGATRMAGPGFAYLIAQFPRANVTQVDGVPLQGEEEDDDDADGDFVRVDIQGTMNSGIVAIGGETTGTTITAGNITWELDLGGFARVAGPWSGKRVRVSGKLEHRRGVEIADRWIVHVQQIRLVDPNIGPRPFPQPIEKFPPQRRQGARDLKQEIELAQARLAEAKAVLFQSEAELNRALTLFERGAIARSKVEEARAAAQQAKLQVDVATEHAQQLEKLAAAIAAQQQPAEEDAQQELTRDVHGGSIKISSEEGSMQIDIHSPEGIGRGEVLRPSDGWSDRIVFRVHTKGLEAFQVKCPEGYWQLSLPTEGNPLVSLRQGNQETEIKLNSNKYPRVLQFSAANGEHLYFQVELPAELMKENPQDLQLHWVDFHRE